MALQWDKGGLEAEACTVVGPHKAAITLPKCPMTSCTLRWTPVNSLSPCKDTMESCFGSMQLSGTTFVVLVQLLELAWLTSAAA